MAFKPAAIPFTSERTATRSELVAPAPARPLEIFLRRFTGEGTFNLLRAKSEVDAAMRDGLGTVPAAPALDDALPPEIIPSVSAGWRQDRVLAEIDQDGFAFALDPMDEPFFNRRLRKTPRQQNKLDIVLVDGRICVRKRFRSYRLGARRWGNRPIPARDWVHRSVWVSLGFYMYTEAAALLRLQDLPFVPKLRKIDVAGRTLYIDYVPGESLRDQAARTGAAVHDADIHKNGELRGLSPHELERRGLPARDRRPGPPDQRPRGRPARHQAGELHPRGPHRPALLVRLRDLPPGLAAAVGSGSHVAARPARPDVRADRPRPRRGLGPAFAGNIGPCILP